MRDYVTKVLKTTTVNVKAQCLDGTGTIEFPIILQGHKELQNDRKTYRMLERVSGMKDRVIIFEITSVCATKTHYRMAVDEFIEAAEVVKTD